MGIEDTEIYKMFQDNEHHRLTRTDYRDNHTFIRRGDTIYRLQSYYQGKAWLKEQSCKFEENNYRVYFPIATIKGDTYIGYEYEKANVANYFLSLGNNRNNNYPNLYWCDIGNHPYPKEVRFRHNWLQERYNRCVHKIIYPNHNIEKCVIFPSDLLGS